jgi:hypothetical protein
MQIGSLKSAFWKYVFDLLAEFGGEGDRWA